jgi:hypothetical protein
VAALLPLLLAVAVLVARLHHLDVADPHHHPCGSLMYM